MGVERGRNHSIKRKIMTSKKGGLAGHSVPKGVQ